MILQKSNNLVSILESDSRFQLVYEDAKAAVFLRATQSSPPVAPQP